MSNKSVLFAVLFVVAIAFGVGAWKYPQIKESLATPEISKEAKAHILHGDKSGGGHLYGTGKACKTEFPKDWDEAEILNNIKKVAANDNLKWKKEKNGYFVATQKVEDVNVRVVLDKERDGVVTAYPINGKMNPCKKSTKAAVKKSVAPAAKTAANDNESVMPNASNRKPRTYNFGTE